MLDSTTFFVEASQGTVSTWFRDDSGAGKTTLAIQYPLEGRRLGQRALNVTLSETAEELAISVVKKRSGRHEDSIREHKLSERGLDVGPSLSMFHAVGQLQVLLDQQPSWSDLPVLILRGEQGGPVARRPISQLVAALGNVSLLDRPLQQITMISAANAATRSRKRQYEARAALHQEQLAVKQRAQFCWTCRA